MEQLEVLYAHWAEQCLDLNSAKEWIYKWVNEWDQILPWENEPEFTSRAMAGHLGNFLDGGTATTGYAAKHDMPYYETTHGSELYFHAWS